MSIDWLFALHEFRQETETEADHHPSYLHDTAYPYRSFSSIRSWAVDALVAQNKLYSTPYRFENSMGLKYKL